MMTPCAISVPFEECNGYLVQICKFNLWASSLLILHIPLTEVLPQSDPKFSVTDIFNSHSRTVRRRCRFLFLKSSFLEIMNKNDVRLKGWTSFHAWPLKLTTSWIPGFFRFEESADHMKENESEVQVTKRMHLTNVLSWTNVSVFRCVFWCRYLENPAPCFAFEWPLCLSFRKCQTPRLTSWPFSAGWPNACLTALCVCVR